MSDTDRRCEYDGAVTGPCRETAIWQLGVIRSCCGNLIGYLCDLHARHGGPPDGWICGDIGTIALTEPVRLSAVAS